jgi:hypothetical protein
MLEDALRTHAGVNDLTGEGVHGISQMARDAVNANVQLSNHRGEVGEKVGTDNILPVQDAPEAHLGEMSPPAVGTEQPTRGQNLPSK